MKILIINSVCGIRSTGKIVTSIASDFQNKGWECKVAYGREFLPEKYNKLGVRIGSSLSVKFNALFSRLFDNDGLNAKNATRKFLKWATNYNPDLLWIHNLHGYYINYELLFNWIKSRPSMKVNWTLHDCWAFTGHCAYFEYVNCNKWMNGCEKCPSLKDYPKAFFDGSKRNYRKKKTAFTSLPIKQLKLITPSKWLANLVNNSFLNKYPIDVVRNEIDFSIYKKMSSNLKDEYGLTGKKILLGVAAVWDRRKGLEDFIRLSFLIPDDYKIVLIGLTKKQLNSLPSNILGLTRTNNQLELVQWYSVSEAYLNLTYEDNYPTTNLEAQACGTPCITYDTGGSIESVPKENVVKKGDLDGVLRILKIH